MSDASVDIIKVRRGVQSHYDESINLNSILDDDDCDLTMNLDGATRNLTPEAYRREHNINLNGEGAEEFVPWINFDDTPYASTLRNALDKAGYESPTSIQAQSWPIALSKRDLISVARTGSGKLVGFIASITFPYARAQG